MAVDMQTPISRNGHSRENSIDSFERARAYADDPASAAVAKELPQIRQMSPVSPDAENILSVKHERQSPPRNAHDRYVCVFSPECAQLTFSRKCEWSKHMDKHDRPYRCQDPACGKLQGFTYSGGLLRHEREVHGKHGGPKEKLQCPYPDCKRHTGNGFTRKENRDEHVRRVHQKRKEEPILRGVEAYATSPRSELSATSPAAPGSTLGKREHASVSPGPSDADRDELRAEIKRLRVHNEDLQSKLDRLQNQMRLSREESRGTAQSLNPAPGSFRPA